MKGERIIN